MPFYTYSGSWRNIKKAWVYVNSAWQPVKKGWVYVSNQWKQFFSGEDVPQISQQVTISQSTADALTGLITLTGTNYNWTNALTLTYYFEWSSDGGSNWNQLSTGSISNPSIGSPNYAYHTVTVAQTSPNIDNLYRFRVYAVNITLNNSSTSTNTTISTPRNITWSTPPITSILYNAATLNFTSGGYANSYKVRIVNTSDNTTTYQTISGSPGTLTGLSSNKNYTVYITGYTSASALGYPGNESSGESFSTPNPPTPVQVTSPTTPTGNPTPFDQVTIGNSGTYNNVGNDPGVITKSLVKILSGTSITNGLTSPLGTSVTSPYSVTQADATIPKFNFYTRDNVIGLDNNTYYYYSTALVSYLGTITDNYNRVSGTGLGISSSGYDYNSYNINSTTWSINGSVAVSSQSVPAATTNSANFAMDTFEVNDSNVSISLAAHGAVPSGSLAGYGTSIWVTSSNSWYAVVSTYDAVFYSNTVATCTGATCCNAGCCPGNSCSGCVFQYNISGVTCTGTGTHQTTTSSTPNCTGFTNSCGGCSLSSTENRYSYSIRGQTSTTTYSYQLWASSTSTTYTYGLCRSTSLTPVCPSCPGGTTSNAQYNCTTGNWQCRCATTSTTFSCGTSFSNELACPAYSSTGAAGYRCSNAATSSGCTETVTTSYPCTGSVSNATSCPAEGSGYGQRCSACTTSTIYNWTYPTNVPYSCDVYAYGVPGTTTVTGYHYNTRLQLVSSVSGSVSYPSWTTGNTSGLIKTTSVNGSFNSNNYIRATGLSVVTSGNVITATGSNSNNDTFTQLTKTDAGFSKTEADGSSSAGVIKGYSGDLYSEGRIDSLQIN